MAPRTRCRSRLLVVLALAACAALGLWQVSSKPQEEAPLEPGAPAQGHRGTLPAFKLGPIEHLKALSASEEQTLEDGKLVLRQEEDPTRGKGLAIRDMAATPDDVMEELLDFSNYKKKATWQHWHRASSGFPHK
eukprot:s132_g14.t1